MHHREHLIGDRALNEGLPKMAKRNAKVSAFSLQTASWHGGATTKQKGAHFRQHAEKGLQPLHCDVTFESAASGTTGCSAERNPR